MRASAALVIVLVGLVGVEAAVVRDAHHFPGAFAFAGVVGGLAIVAAAKLIGLALQRPDDAPTVPDEAPETAPHRPEHGHE